MKDIMRIIIFFLLFYQSIAAALDAEYCSRIYGEHHMTIPFQVFYADGFSIEQLSTMFNVSKKSIELWSGLSESEELSKGDCLLLPSREGIIINSKNQSATRIAVGMNISIEQIESFNEIADVDTIYHDDWYLFIPQHKRHKIPKSYTRPVTDAYTVSALGFDRDPFTGKYRFREFQNIQSTVGLPVLAMSDGFVRRVTRREIVIEHEDGIVVTYRRVAHSHLAAGETVVKGQQIGLTNYSTCAGRQTLVTVSQDKRFMDIRSLYR